MALFAVPSSDFPFRPPREELTQAEPFAVALGNLTPTNPRATARGRTTDDRTDGWTYGFGRSDGRTDGGGGLGWRLARIGRTDQQTDGRIDGRTDGAWHCVSGMVFGIITWMHWAPRM